MLDAERGQVSQRRSTVDPPTARMPSRSDTVVAGDQMPARDLGVVPDEMKGRSSCPSAPEAVGRRVEVPAEVASGTVDRLTEGAGEALDVGDEAAIEAGKGVKEA
ncbi:hypothetical protein Pta02_70170 [Planobispora takensis]|uniref:Uncharacterized protein n=1 Tax=Planobispora takensis TaxID=1367882 RepID=A0A8J3T299_9ACTN|nr:hypothetical protein Pta02_70170 [Planobispora takensis]